MHARRTGRRKIGNVDIAKGIQSDVLWRIKQGLDAANYGNGSYITIAARGVYRDSVNTGARGSAVVRDINVT
jgi:hypothetical protein